MVLNLLALGASAAFALPGANAQLARYVQQHAPKSVDDEGRWAAAAVRVFVDPKGKILECELKRFAGDGEVARQLCGSMIGQRMSAPRDFSGRTVHGFGNMTVSVAPGSKRVPSGILGLTESEHVELQVAGKNTISTRIPESFDLNLLVSADGSVQGCQAREKVTPALVDAACKQVSFKAFSRKSGADGAAVPYIQMYSVKVVIAN